MWIIVYKNNHNRVLYLGGTSEMDCLRFLLRNSYEASDFIIQKVA